MNRVKYPRTYHAPWSEGKTSDDKVLKNCSSFVGKEVVVTEKLDGEGTTIYPDSYVHARSTDSDHHPSRSVIKQLAANTSWQIPEGHRVCGENLYAYHSIFYVDLPSYFLAFGVYEGDRCLSWDDTEKLCLECGFSLVPVLYRGVWDEKRIRNLWQGKGDFPTFETEVFDPKFPDDFKPVAAEGYVIRLTESFLYEDFGSCCAKYVRENHVRTDSNWKERKIVQNLLRKD
jgi:hypothetical protein